MEAAGANSDAGSDVPDDANISDVDSEAEFGHDSSGVSDDEEANVGLESDGEGADEAAAGDEDGSEIASEAEDDEGVAQIICFGCQTPMNFSRIKLAPATGYMTECDGGCHRALPPAELRYVCPMSCDFDVCTVVLHQPQPVVAVTYMERCYCCDEEVGGGDGGQCSALQLLASLRDEMERRDEMIEAKVAEGEVDMDFERKGARYFMYRTFVAAKYGYLGPGLRYKLPDCVVAAIRSRYRALACDCDTVRDLAACTEHGYTGYRER